ncbi:MAG: LysM peptidoglycan-binding domain-containing protein, partial [Anaerolineales bacterium]
MVCLLLGFTVACGRGTGPAATPTPLIPLPLPLPTNTIAPATSLPATATPPPTPSLTTPPPGAPLGQHTVREGETLSCIGRAYAVPPSAIAQASNLSASEVLPVGTVLQIPAVRWEGVPPGPVCVPQFQSPFVSTPLITPTPAVAGLEKILIVEPGSGSSVTSPVRVTGQADPTFEQSLVVQVFNENGEAIATVPVQIAADISQRGPFAVDVPFSVS